MRTSTQYNLKYAYICFTQFTNISPPTRTEDGVHLEILTTILTDGRQVVHVRAWGDGGLVAWGEGLPGSVDLVPWVLVLSLLVLILSGLLIKVYRDKKTLQTNLDSFINQQPQAPQEANEGWWWFMFWWKKPQVLVASEDTELTAIGSNHLSREVKRETKDATSLL